MASKFSVSLAEIIKEERYDTLYMPEDPETIMVSTADVNRPSLMFSGYSEYFDNSRIQFIGIMERGYLDHMGEDGRRDAIDFLFSRNPKAVILTRGQDPFEDLMVLAKKYKVPILHTKDSTSSAMSSLIYFLSEKLAPRITRHGVLVEVYGEGVLILGDSGVGKSETAVELVKRGHRLIADDAVEIRKINNKTLYGTAPENIRHFIEVRGIGIIDARRIFGMGAVKVSEKINMCIQLEIWDGTKAYNLIGLEEEYYEILGVQVPSHTVPIKPGRNLAIIIEIAAMNYRQKKLGYNAAQELLNKLEDEFGG